MDNSSAPHATSKVIQTNSIKEDHEEAISITEIINLTKKRYQVLNIICNTYEESISQYLQEALEALVKAMRFDIEEGNFCEALLERIGSEDKAENNSPLSSPDSLALNLMNSNLDLLKKLQTQIS